MLPWFPSICSPIFPKEIFFWFPAVIGCQTLLCYWPFLRTLSLFHCGTYWHLPPCRIVSVAHVYKFIYVYIFFAQISRFRTHFRWKSAVWGRAANDCQGFDRDKQIDNEKDAREHQRQTEKKIRQEWGILDHLVIESLSWTRNLFISGALN